MFANSRMNNITPKNMEMPLNIGELTFYEPFNLTKLQYIVNNPEQYKDQIKKEEAKMRRRKMQGKNYNAYAVFQKNINNAIKPPKFEGTEYAFIKVTYRKGTKSNGQGRWHANNGIGLQPLCACVRHTICDGKWLDVDQVNSHPSILQTLMKKHGFESELLDECVNNRDVFLLKVDKDRDEAKTQIIASINGCKYNNPVLNDFCTQIHPCIKHIIELPEYQEDYEYVKKTYPDDKNIMGKTISRILQNIENDLLESYINFLYDKGVIDVIEIDGIKGLQVSLIFDGFQLLLNDKVTDDLLKECRSHAFNVTGYDIPLKIKAFDQKLKLPDNYAECCEDLPSLVNKFSVGIESFVENNHQLFEDAINSEGSHLKVAKVGKKLFKDILVFDSDTRNWYYCNINNIWKERKDNDIVKGLFQEVLPLYFKTIRCKMLAKSYDYDKNPETKALGTVYMEKSNVASKIAQQLENNSFVKNVCETAVSQFTKEKFYESKLDSNTHLFAFSDKVVDLKKTKADIRYIRPDDYIMTNTGYKYPEYMDNEMEICKQKNEIHPKEQFIDQFLKTLFPNGLKDENGNIYPDDEMVHYILDTICVSLYGCSAEQYFDIFSGKGSNAKTTLNNAVDASFGNYAVRISPETFTKPKKGMNDASELYKAKGKRRVTTNEPNSEGGDDKIRSATMKPLAEGGNQTINVRRLYSDAFEIKVGFKITLTCNDEPDIDSTDGGISRRLRVVKFRVKFVDEPVENNKLQAKRDPDFINNITDDTTRDCLIMKLINRWFERVSKFKTIPVPKQVIDDSKKYIKEANPVRGFINEFYDITNNTNHTVQSSVLFNDFKFKNGDVKMLARDFKKEVLHVEGVDTKHTNKGTVYTGLKMKPDSDDE